MALPDSAKELIRSGALGHLVTIGDRGAPQVTCVWVGVEGDELLTAHLNPRLRKLDNVRRDPRVAVSFEGTRIHPPGLREYVVVHGRATIEEGGAPSCSRSSRACTSAGMCAFRRWTIPHPASGCGLRSNG
jgi:PPOX class probable F420-dependent enzyme